MKLKEHSQFRQSRKRQWHGILWDLRGFCRLGISDWLFHRPALSIGQKTELSLLRVFIELERNIS